MITTDIHECSGNKESKYYTLKYERLKKIIILILAMVG
jgi:hypothetical protein